MKVQWQVSATARAWLAEREMARDNRRVRSLDLAGIPPAPRVTPPIEVTFYIDANGNVYLIAEDNATNEEQQIRIQPCGGLSDAELADVIDMVENQIQTT
jgi:molecular chaperone DnaK